MPNFLIFTVIGPDRPGLVGELSATVSAHQGSWLESSMAQLAGQFAGIVKIAVPADQELALRAALATLEGRSGLTITIASGSASAATGAPRAARRLKLNLVGNDRLGIVREVSQVLARFAVNVESLETRTSSAPMSADLLFHAEAELTAAADLDANALTSELERLSADLMVDIALDETLRRN